MRDKIIKGALELFMQRGIRSVTMDDIASHLGMSKRTIYEKFKDKNELLEHSINEFQADNKRKYMHILKENASCLTGLLSIIYYVYKNTDFDCRPHEVFFMDLKKYYPELYANMQDNKRTSVLSTSSYLKSGVKEGTIRNDINLDLVAMLLLTQIEGLSVMTEITKRYHPKEILRTMALSFCRGIATRKGMEEIEEFTNKYRFE